MRLLRRPLREDEFWSLIDVLEGSSDEDAVARLVEALRVRGRRTAVAFAERLAIVLHDLDREVLANQAVRWSDDEDDEDDDPIPLSDDSFLYLRADVVARGRDMVARVLADPDVLLEHRWDDGEALLYAADEAAGREIETRVSYETGSNEAHWSPREDVDAASYRRPAVAVMVRDMTAPLELETHLADGTSHGSVFHLPPDWLRTRIVTAVNDGICAVVEDAGGLPDDFGDVQIEAQLDVGDRWALEPRVERGVPEEWGGTTVTHARVELPGAELAARTRAEQEQVLDSLAATCVLAALPADHAARPRLEKVAADGRALLPEA